MEDYEMLLERIMEQLGLSAADQEHYRRSIQRGLISLKQRMDAGEKIQLQELWTALLPGPLQFSAWGIMKRPSDQPPLELIRYWRERARAKALDAKAKQVAKEKRALRRQATVYYNLADALDQLQHCQQESTTGADKDKRMQELSGEYSKYMRQAARNGLAEEDGRVRDYIATAKALGAYKYLRSTKMGIETGIEPPYSKSDRPLIQLALDGKTRAEARRILIQEGIILPQVTDAAFYKQVKPIWDAFYEPPPGTDEPANP